MNLVIQIWKHGVVVVGWGVVIVGNWITEALVMSWWRIQERKYFYDFQNLTKHENLYVIYTYKTVQNMLIILKKKNWKNIAAQKYEDLLSVHHIENTHYI